MIAEHISLEHLPRILSNKPLLEHFLSALLDKTVQLWKTRATRNKWDVFQWNTSPSLSKKSSQCWAFSFR